MSQRLHSSQLCEGCRRRAEMARGNLSLQASLCGDCAALVEGGEATVVFDNDGVSRQPATDSGVSRAAPLVGGHVSLDRGADRPLQLSTPAAIVAGAGLLGAGLAVGWWIS